MAWTRDKYPVWFLKVSNSSLTGRQPELQRTSSLSHSAGEDGSCISGDGGFGPPSSPTPVFLPGESQGRGSLVGWRLWGRTESDTTEVT